MHITVNKFVINIDFSFCSDISPLSVVKSFSPLEMLNFKSIFEFENLTIKCGKTSVLKFE
jgi:hypothetical protein